MYLESDGAVRIADFSLGRRVRELIALANAVRLEDPYPPSIGRGGKKSDIFRLGLVLVSLVTGRRVEDQLPVLRHTVSGGCALPASLEDFLGRCLWKDERDRWTAAQLLEHPFLRDAVARPLLEQEAGQARQLNNRSPSPVLGRCNPFSSLCSGLGQIILSGEPNLTVFWIRDILAEVGKYLPSYLRFRSSISTQ